MKVITHTITHQAKSAVGQIESIMHPAKFAGRQIESIMYPAKLAGGYSNSIMYPAKFAGGRSRLDLLLPSFLPSREEKKKQDRIFCPLRGHAVGRMQYAPTSCWQKTLFPINSREERTETKIQDRKNRPLGSRGVLHMPHMDRVRTEKKMQERRKQSIDSGVEWHTPFMRQGKRDTVWRDRRLEERSSHARLQLKISGENSKPYKSYLVALSEQLRDIFAA
ncbi:hypothetical protein T230_09875 [Tannerella sp. oral taxon BU063 isolate Cell 1/3]|uniref:Uncharacterized protein n=1 Tax=Tannerella sp. oral taxon BU063 isolate Cell 1/3 TaxID=1411022 RepID=W2CI69_9BACT|nr:hypothetical protein T230_09875 [Tannerella sp. oral taxon BU063 isolate Cell 1/3]